MQERVYKMRSAQQRLVEVYRLTSSCYLLPVAMAMVSAGTLLTNTDFVQCFN